MNTKPNLNLKSIVEENDTLVVCASILFQDDDNAFTDQMIRELQLSGKKVLMLDTDFAELEHDARGEKMFRAMLSASALSRIETFRKLGMLEVYHNTHPEGQWGDFLEEIKDRERCVIFTQYGSIPQIVHVPCYYRGWEGLEKW